MPPVPNELPDHKRPASNFLSTDKGKTKPNTINTPSITLPKGGGALKGIDEKFSVNAVNGTASFSIPLPFGAARGASPALNLSYNSGAGNSVFGLGWQLDLASIKRKTDKQLPQYLDGVDSDTFLFSGAEDLVPVFKKEPDGSFSKDANDEYVILENDSPDNLFLIRYYRPRIEGLFARIEKWTSKTSAAIKWRVITSENGTTLFGWSPASRIADPANADRVIEWLPEFIFDDKGNCSQFIYKKEDDAGFDTALLHHRNRYTNGQITYTNLYLEKVLYGNTTPYNNFNDPMPAETDYLFQTIFDYGEYDPVSPYDKINDWDFRQDAFSDFKAGFEIRTTRLCKRVLQFHYFNGPGEYQGLVRSCNFEYDTTPESGLTFLRSVSMHGYIKKDDGSYSHKSLPATEFQYQQHDWDPSIKSLAADNLVHAPAGVDENIFQLIDLFNEGLPGMLTEQANGWYYKHNLGEGRFDQAKLIGLKPSFTGWGKQLQLIDLAADGGKQLVNFNSEPKGYFELNDEDTWQPFRAFQQFPNIDMNDPNLRLLDLNGDGQPEAVITEDQVFTWYASAGREGFASIQQTAKPFDEESGPSILFANLTQTIFLADMSGDGLTDIVRVRNGEVCYWPNLGYGKFGAKIGMDNAPVFDHPDAFNPDFLKLADIDGSGTTDIIYLGKNKFSCWRNSCGNAFNSIPFEITEFPAIHNQATITVTDLLGNGVACIVWSSNLQKDETAPVQYIDLMNSRKPYLMTGYKNNLGKEVLMSYTPSTKYYIEDKLAGKPWITKLHFPVHCISRTEIIDYITGHHFVSTYKYHHGYFDHAEQEFRGFGMVEQTDAEHFEHWVKENAANIVEEALHQEPVITKSWFHTGAFVNREKILTQFAQEYWYEEMNRQGFTATHSEALLADARIVAAAGIDPAFITHLSVEEWQQALRACKSMALRSEVFAHDAPLTGATADQLKKQLTPYSVATHNCVVELLQPKGRNQFAVFIVKEGEAITYNYERNTEDPRIAHNLNIRLDEYGNILESVTVVYPRKIADLSLPADTQEAQQTTTIIFTQNGFTNDVITNDAYRLRLPAEGRTFDMKGIGKAGDYYTIADFENIISTANEVAYHETATIPAAGTIQKRLTGHSRSIYYRNDLLGALPLYQLESLAFRYEGYQLAYTPALLADIYSGRVKPADMTEGRFTHSEGDENWWIRSGTTQFITTSETAASARQRFYTPLSYTDPYGAITKVSYYGNYFLFINETEDALGNKAKATLYNFRTLSPQRLVDLNNNLSEIICDELGMVKAMAVLGKGNEADDLTGLTDVTAAAETALVNNFLSAPGSDTLHLYAKQLLQHATARFVYDPEAYINTGKPVVTASIVREEHFQQNNNSPVQLSFEYSSGTGQTVMKKVQAEPGLAKQAIIQPDGTYTITEVDTAAMDPVQLRWIGNGRTIVNNKGNVVKKYEPYFSVTHRYEDLKELVETGVTPVMYYDAAGRLIKTRMPDGTLSRTEFDNWQLRLYDPNDTVLETECTWYHNRTNRLIDALLIAAGKDPEKEKAAADKAALHANTPTVQHFDSLGRPVLSIEHNKQLITGADEFSFSKVKLDTEGNLRQVTDARDNVVFQYKYDMPGNLVYQHSMDAGQRWNLINILGQPLRTWDERNHEFQYFYDLLHRPAYSKVVGGDGSTPLNHIYARIFYSESELLPDRSNEAVLQAKNTLGQPLHLYDTGGLISTPGYDFKGKPVSISRKLFRKYKEVADWTDANLVADLEDESYTFSTSNDALGRMTSQTAPDGSITIPTYNETGLLTSKKVNHNSPAITTTYIKDIDYNEKGQRTRIIYGNDVISRFYYDTETFRLKRLETKRGNNDPLQNWHYTFDAVGNITHIEDKNIPVVFFDNQKVTGVATYTYDALYRLVEATGRENNTSLDHNNSSDNWNDASFMHAFNPGDPMAVKNYIQTYQYDIAGNITEMRHAAAGNDWTRNYEYATTSNRLINTSVGQGANMFHYAYQHHATHGFITVLPHLEDLGWNFKEQLVRTIRQRRTDGGTPETTYYQYDGQGQRIRKITENTADAGITPGKKEERIYISGYELYKKHSGANAGLQRQTLSLIDGGNRFVMIETRNDVDDGTEIQLVRYQLHNYLGSASLELDATAQVISYEEYHPFGTTAFQARNNSIKAAAKRYRYTGMERDEETGLAYHSARYYLPWLGRWLNADPIGLKGGLNVYRYSGNNPVIKTDTSGTDEVTIYHRTTEAGAASMTRAGARTDMSRPHVWAGGGFYGSSSSSIPSSSGASGDVIVGQRISTDRLADLDAISSRPGLGHNIVGAMQDTADGRAIRSQIYQQMYDARDQLARTLGRTPSDADIERYFRDYMNRVLDRIAPNADVLRWRNPDGTFTYVVRRQTAMIGAPTVAGRMTRRGFRPAEPPRTATPSTEPPRRSTATPEAPRTSTAAPDAPRSSFHAPDTPHGRGLTTTLTDTAEGLSRGRRLAGTFGRRVLMAVPGIDVITQQVTYEDSAYTGDRGLDALLNLTVGEFIEIPLAVYSGAELAAYGLMQAGSAVSEAADSALEHVAEEYVAPVLGPWEMEARRMFGGY